jgi:NAD(P)-dependent dehydrogenase (short-subunit alcohol dehydrogenase family)
MNFEGKVVLVTGASRGIGAAISDELAALGAKVIGTATTDAGAQAIGERLSAHGGAGRALNVTDGAAIESLIESIGKEFGPISILVNNAGIGSYEERPIWDQATTIWRETMTVNLDAPFWLTRAAVPDMIDAGWGRIVMISSTAGEVGAPAMSAYCASKHGLIGLMRSVAADTIAHGVTCNAILPGWVRTTMADADAAAEAEATSKTVDEVWQERAAGYAANRVLDPSEIAGVVRFLASDDASGVNGEAITVALGSHW